MKKAIVFCFLLLLFSLAHAKSSDIYPFDDAKLQQRFRHLNQTLRCLVCQNQNLAGSNAPLAQDLRRQIYNKLHQGKSDNDIISYMTARYGDFVLFKPPFKLTTAILWLAPGLFLLLGFFVLWYSRRDVDLGEYKEN